MTSISTVIPYKQSYAKMAAIYLIRNTENQRCYIGLSAQVGRRMAGHRTLLRTGKHSNPMLQADWMHYGESAFDFGIISFVDQGDYLFDVEEEYIDTYRDAGVDLYNSHSMSEEGRMTVRAIILSDTAAAALRSITPRYSSRRARQKVNDLIELHADRQLIAVTDDMIAAVAYLETARQQCFSEAAQRGLDHLVAALWVAKNQRT